MFPPSAQANVSQVEPGSIDPQLVSPANSSCVGEGNLFLYPLRFRTGDLSMKLMKDILIGAMQLYSFLTVCAQASREKEQRTVDSESSYATKQDKGRGEKPLTGEQMNFRKDKWTLRRTNGR